MAEYVKKPAPAHLSEKQKKEWDYGEEQRYQASMKKDTRTMEQIAPQVESMTPAKSAEGTAKAGTERQMTEEDKIRAQLKKDKIDKYFK